MKPRAKKPAKRIFLDISSQKKISLGGKQHWLLILDDATDNAFSYFLKTRDQLSSVVIPLINNLNACQGFLSVLYIVTMLERQLRWRESAKKPALAFSLNTLCQTRLNKIVNLSISLQRYGDACALWWKVHSYLASYVANCGQKRQIQPHIWTTFILLRVLRSVQLPTFFGKDISRLLNCIMAERNKKKSKLTQRNNPCICLGYTKDHKACTYCLYNTVTDFFC